MPRSTLGRMLASFGSALALVACATDAPPAGYYEALREIRLNLRSPEGGYYARQVFLKMRNDVERVARRCYVEAPDTRGAQLLYRLDAEGAPTESIVHPPAPFAECVHRGLRNLEDFDLPPPPREEHWILVSATY